LPGGECLEVTARGEEEEEEEEERVNRKIIIEEKVRGASADHE
jgi:hypothetical protein